MLHNYTLKIIYHTDRINTYQLYPHVRLLLPMKPACQRSAATRILYQTAHAVFGLPLLSAIGELFRCLFTYVTENLAGLLSVISGIVTTAESTGFFPF